MDIDLYGGSKVLRCVYKAVERLIAAGESLMHEAIEKCSGLKSPAKFDSILTDAKRVIGLGAKMGEGWLLAGEIVDLVKNGFENIVCAQPFGCLPNHVVGKGMIAKIRQFHPGANITAIDYDASASAVNQENRIKLMLAVANDELANRHVPEVYVIPAKESKEKMVSIPA